MSDSIPLSSVAVESTMSSLKPPFGGGTSPVSDSASITSVGSFDFTIRLSHFFVHVFPPNPPLVDFVVILSPEGAIVRDISPLLLVSPRGTSCHFALILNPSLDP